MTRVVFLSFYYLLNCVLTAETFSVLLTLPLFLVCCFNVYHIKESTVVAEDMIWLTAHLFFVIGPCQAIHDGFIGVKGPVTGISFTDQELFQASFLIFIFFLFSTMTKFFVRRHRHSQQPDAYQIGAHSIAILLPLNFLAFFLFVFFSGGFSNVLASRSEKITSEISSVSTIFVSLQIVVTILIATTYKTTSHSKWPPIAFFVSIILLFFSQNPFNTARYYLIAAWLPVFLVMIRGRMGVATFYTSVFFAIIVLLPILSLTSRFGASVEDAIGNINTQDTFFRLPYVDSFDMIVYEIRYLSHNDYLWGEKTLGILLFFIPRAIWSSKPTILTLDMGSGLEAAKIAGTSNLALFFPGELYADFGLLGVACGAVLITYALMTISLARSSSVNGLEVKSYILIASIPILLRGAIAVTGPLTLLELFSLSGLILLFAKRIRTSAKTTDGQRYYDPPPRPHAR